MVKVLTVLHIRQACFWVFGFVKDIWQLCDFSWRNIFCSPQIAHWWLIKGRIPLKASFMNQWVYWAMGEGRFQERKYLKGNRIGRSLSSMWQMTLESTFLEFCAQYAGSSTGRSPLPQQLLTAHITLGKDLELLSMGTFQVWLVSASRGCCNSQAITAEKWLRNMEKNVRR